MGLLVTGQCNFNTTLNHVDISVFSGIRLPLTTASLCTPYKCPLHFFAVGLFYNMIEPQPLCNEKNYLSRCPLSIWNTNKITHTSYLPYLLYIYHIGFMNNFCISFPNWALVTYNTTINYFVVYNKNTHTMIYLSLCILASEDPIFLALVPCSQYCKSWVESSTTRADNPSK